MRTLPLKARASVAAAIVVMVGGFTADLRPAQPLEILFTADTDGQLAPMPAGAGGTEVGGLARRASLIAGARREAPALLVLDGGNALFGADSLESAGKAVVVAYEALLYDAVNVSYRDFRLGKAATIAALKDSKLAAISANLLDEQTGELLLKPYAVLNRGGERTAVLGATEAPAGLEVLPHLLAQLAGIRIEPPLEALARHLPRAKAESDRVLLLYYGSPAGLRPIISRHGSSLSAVLAGGARPELLPAAVKPPVVGTGALAGEVVRITLTGVALDAEAEVHRLAVDASIAPDPAVQQLLAPFVRTQPDPLYAVGASIRAASRVELPAAAEPEKIYRLDLAAANRGARLGILTAALVTSYAGAAAPPGRKLLLLDTEWENIIPLTMIQEQKVPTEYRVPNLADHLYLVVDGSRIERLLPGAESLAGHVPVKDFRLERIGSRTRGNVIFPVPPEEAPPKGMVSLDLRFYDYAHGHMSVMLRWPAAGAAPPPKPLSPPQRNEVLEAAAYGIERLAEIGGRAAPPWMEFLAVDFRARSLFLIDADATAFDPKARSGSRVKVGTVADWLESRRYVQLVADGEHAYAPLPESTLVEEPRFLPDVPTGGRIVFLAPVKRASLELRCDFPNARSSSDGKVFRPQGITVPLEGRRPRLEARKALLSIADDVFDVAVTGLATAGELAGRKAGEDKRFLTLDVTVSNTGKKGELFQTQEQLKLALSDGALLAIDAAALESLRPPLPLVWIPPGERRTFQAAYRVPASEGKPRLAYAGVSLQQAFALPAPQSVPDTPAAVATPVRAPNVPGEKPQSSPKKQPPAESPVPGEARPATPAAVATPAAGSTPPSVATPAAKPSREPQGLAGVGLTPEKVNEAIDRGAAFLWGYLKNKDLKASRHSLGDDREHTIAALALVHSGAHKKFPDFDVSLRAYLASVDPRRGDVYQAGIVCMLVEAYGDPSFLPSLRAATRYLLEVQGPEGSWSYTRRFPEAVFRDPAADRVIQVSGGVPLDGGDAAPAVSRITDWKDGLDGDNSVSQYALLGLQAASRAGVRIDPEVWRRSLESFRSRQGDDGNWYYHGKSRTGYGSMTCAGICSVAIARHEQGEKEPAADPAVQNGLEWLGRSFSVDVHPQHNPPKQWRFYYLYSLERVGRVLGIDFVGTHEWYPEGAKHLVDSQAADGSWVGDSEEKDPRLATSFALLFLTRSTPSLRPRELKRGGSGILRTGIVLPRGSRYYVILDASGSMTAEMDGKTKWQIAKDAVARLVEDLPDTSEVALRVYGHRKLAIEDGASDDTALEIPLRRIMKKDFLTRLESLRPRGKTPLARSILEAKRDLGGAAASDPVTVILLTDGGEDTLPRQDPVRAAAALGELKGIRFHVIGFDIGREDWSAQLEAIAERGQGWYWPASKAESLHAELRAAVFGVPPGFVVLDQAGKEAARGPFGWEGALLEGRYVFQTSYAGVDHEESFWINTERTTQVVFNAAKVVAARPAPGAVRPGASARPAPDTRPEARPKPKPDAKPVQAPGDSRPAVAPPTAKSCTECGKPLKPDAKFCSSCGAKAKG